mmetsp:Transcript_8643/g.53633  ORF Transcript_8643/g.53633 Transcript_8643/m.53633 type:complete len:252 (+) Transcript_8643:134-889(+)
MGHRRSASENLANRRYLDEGKGSSAVEEVEMLGLGDFCCELDMQCEVARMFTEHPYNRHDESWDEVWLDFEPHPGTPLEPVGECVPCPEAGVSDGVGGEECMSAGSRGRKSRGKGKGKEPASELMSMDIKRMKRVMANRLSAARSKERKVKYVHELEEKLQRLRSSISQSSIQVKILETDVIDLEAENMGLIKRLEVGHAESQQQQNLIQELAQQVERLRAELPIVSHDSMRHNREGFDSITAHTEPVHSE